MPIQWSEQFLLRALVMHPGKSNPQDQKMEWNGMKQKRVRMAGQAKKYQIRTCNQTSLGLCPTTLKQHTL